VCEDSYFFRILKKNAPFFAKTGRFFCLFVQFCSYQADFFHLNGADFQFIVPLLAKSAKQAVANTLVDVDAFLSAQFPGASAHVGLLVVVHGRVFSNLLEADGV
jgi:hypothetical protein